MKASSAKQLYWKTESKREQISNNKSGKIIEGEKGIFSKTTNLLDKQK